VRRHIITRCSAGGARHPLGPGEKAWSIRGRVAPSEGLAHEVGSAMAMSPAVALNDGPPLLEAGAPLPQRRRQVRAAPVAIARCRACSRPRLGHTSLVVRRARTPKSRVGARASAAAGGNLKASDVSVVPLPGARLFLAGPASGSRIFTWSAARRGSGRTWSHSRISCTRACDCPSMSAWGDPAERSPCRA